VKLWRLLRGHVVVRNFFHYAKKARDGKRIVEKSNANVDYIAHIFSAFPDARIIFIIRHPVDVFASYRRRFQDEKEDGQYAGWLDISVEEFVRRKYRPTAKKSLAQLDSYADRSTKVRYEDFTTGPAEEFKRLCEFVHEPVESQPVSGSVDALKDWHADPHLARPITPSTKDWKDYVSIGEAHRIEEDLSGLIDEFGYERYT
jgi:hypothetical protein